MIVMFKSRSHWTFIIIKIGCCDEILKIERAEENLLVIRSTDPLPKDFVRTKIFPEMKNLVLRYLPEVFWSDGDVGPDTYWNSTEFIAWLYNKSPVRDTVVTNDRWGDGCMCKHGGYYTCEDHYRPGRLVEHKWENCMTLDRNSWGFRREARLNDFVSPEVSILQSKYRSFRYQTTTTRY